jgi:hypothetical protein
MGFIPVGPVGPVGPASPVAPVTPVAPVAPVAPVCPEAAPPSGQEDTLLKVRSIKVQSEGSVPFTNTATMELSLRTQNDAAPVGKDTDDHSKAPPNPSANVVVMGPGLNDGTNCVYDVSADKNVPNSIVPLLLVYESCPFENVSTAALLQIGDERPEGPKKAKA